LPETLAKSKIVFIGPPGSAMRSLGDKISSTIVAQHANVPCMAWSGTGISDTVLSPQGFVTVPEKAYDDACVHSWEEGLDRAEKIGFPVMIKASEGGGGKGIRKVDDAEKFRNSFQAVAGEVPGESSISASHRNRTADVLRLPHLHHEARRIRSPSRGPAHRRPVRQRHLPLWP
jgi:acetyl-CoA carboxylase/biotin carboxylase 1